MTTLTIEIPDDETAGIIKYLKEKHVVIKEAGDKITDGLTADDYRRDALSRAKNRRGSAGKYL